ncbi:1648_t:CDS:2 [Diversispora eburnea]|uniref:peptidyl-tRNA hydrolase n=1 Tax=Diversispora eburnea TaxID=1213867 RepID=A0A9N8YXA0_9GLOM|nr:1648_t:CDS:2 [Diversispora eburnea]
MSRPVDYIIAGLGNPEPEYANTRHNAGYIFIDYLANVMTLTQGEVQNPPVFYRRIDLSADVRDTIFNITNETGTSIGSNSIRVILMKPLIAMNESGLAIQKVMRNYNFTNLKKLIVVADDLNTLPGILMIQGGGDLAAMKGHKGLENIVSKIDSISITQWVLGQFSKENREMDLFGHLLQLTTQALKDYNIHQDLKRVKKKYAQAKKLPNKLNEMNSLIFPVDVHGV